MNALVLLPLLASLSQEPTEKTGPHFRVVNHVPIEALADDALVAAEAVWPLALEALGRKEKELESPLTTHLYPDQKSYEEGEAQLTKGALKGNLVFSHLASKSAHVLLQPSCSDEGLRAYAMRTLPRYLVAPEATHPDAYAFLPNALDHPDWFAEGAATYAGFQALEKLGQTRKQIEEPLSATSLQLCREMVAKGTLPTANGILSSEVGTLEFQQRYAVDHEFYAFLRAQAPKDLARAVDAIASTGGGEGYRKALAAALDKIWSEKELEKLSDRFEAFLQQEKPRWKQEFRSLETRGEGYIQRAFPEKNAVAFRVDSSIDKLPASVSGTLHIWPGSSMQMNFLLGRSEGGFLSVALTAGQGVTVFRYDHGQPEPWTNLAFGESKDLLPGVDVPFRIELGKNELVVYVAEKEIARAALGGRSPIGPWGLGAQAGATGEWKDIQVKAKR